MKVSQQHVLHTGVFVCVRFLWRITCEISFAEFAGFFVGAYCKKMPLSESGRE